MNPESIRPEENAGFGVSPRRGAVSPRRGAVSPRRGAKEKGIAIIISSIMMMFTVGIVGLAIDGGVAYFVKGRLMAAVDSAALAAGRSLNLADDLSDVEQVATTGAERFFKANFPDGFMGTDPTLTHIDPDFEMIMQNGSPTGVLKVTVTGDVTAPTYFMKIFSVPSLKIAASGTATRRTLVMMLILDVSGSMGSRQTSVGTIPATVSASSRSCDAMIYAAARFIRYFSPYDYVGLTTFSSSSRVVYPPSTQFKAAGSAGMTDDLAGLNCSGGTNTAPALNISWDEIKGVGLKLALNAIVLFTDGMPNQVTGDWPLRTQIDTRYGPGPTYSTGSAPPTNTNLLYRDRKNPYTFCRNSSGVEVTCPALPTPYSSAQNTARTTHGVTTPLYGDSRFLPLTTAQWNSYNNGSPSTTLGTTAKNSFGWRLPSASGPYQPRWIQDNNAPDYNYENCRDQNQYYGVANRGVTWMCYQLPLPTVSGVGGTTMKGTFSQATTYQNSSNNNPISYHETWGDKSNSWGRPTDTVNTTGIASGFPSPTGTNGGRRAAAQTFAFIPDTDAMGNSNRGFRDDWVYNVNQGCAPAGTPVPGGDLCKWRGGTWANYPTVGLGTNKWANGSPYEGKLRTDLPNAYPAAAMNAAVSAANRIKNDTEYNIRIDTIYLIGNEDTVDREFLQVISNQEMFKGTIFDNGTVTPYTNPYFNQAHQKGLWYFTTNGAELSTLFAAIASSLLRISK